jgi:hypothetical protein
VNVDSGYWYIYGLQTMNTKTKPIHWESRIAPPRGAYDSTPPPGTRYELECEGKNGEEYYLDVIVDAEWQIYEKGGWSLPESGGCHSNACAYWYREGRGWKEIPLTWRQDMRICEFLDGD